MKDGSLKKSKLSWPKTIVNKWLNIKTKEEDFHDNGLSFRGIDEGWRNSFCEKEERNIMKSKTEKPGKRNSDRIMRSKIDLESFQTTDVQNYRIFVATWNVGGRSPPNNLSLDEWLHTSPRADIYILGFQEIVPLNAGNVLGTEDKGPSKRWLALIRKTLNSLHGTSSGCHIPTPAVDPLVELDADFEGSTRGKASFFHQSSLLSLTGNVRLTDNCTSISQPILNRHFSVCERSKFAGRRSDYDPNIKLGGFSDDENGSEDSPSSTHYSPISYNGSFTTEDRERQRGQSRYSLVASKKKVGIFLTVWARSDLSDNIRNLKVSCIGRGLMGYLGNKGAISISMLLHRTSFCFICSHLTSGEREGDELRRNSDVMEILRKTRFPRVQGKGGEKSPQTILEHDRIIWLGDLNYRIALAYQHAKLLVEMRNWKALLENDQLRIEQQHGRVFEGWREGNIYFPPTYKYSNNSDRYSGENMHPKEKRRTPAWCDRILWFGRGLHQVSYVRGESKFSDHRPVYSLFLAEVESVNRSVLKKSTSYNSSRVEIEELLPYPHRQSERLFY